MSVAKIPKTLYDGRVRKIYVFIIVIFLFFTLALFSYNKTHAQGCRLTIDPSIIPLFFNGEITITSSSPCFQPIVQYKVLIYPQRLSLDDLYSKPSLFPLLMVDNAISIDEKTLKADLNLSQRGSSEPLNILVCTDNTKTSECDKEENIVAAGAINLTIPITPTPTPQEDQPIIDPTAQSQCVFQVGSAIPLIAENIKPNQTYRWWWTKDGGEGLIDSGPFDEEASPYLNFTIPETQTNKRKTTEKEPDGYLVCIDIEEKGKKRGGANCIRLFFKAYNPKENGIDISCSPNNAGDTAPPSKSSLPPCSQWLYLNGTPIPTPVPGEINPIYNDPDFKNRKCGEVPTAIGGIKTDPFDFVKSILSILLSLAGGIAVILIIISGYRLMTSQGNPEAVQAAREQLTSAIVGLVFVVFSLVILQVIGVDILQIPGFER